MFFCGTLREIGSEIGEKTKILKGLVFCSRVLEREGRKGRYLKTNIERIR